MAHTEMQPARCGQQIYHDIAEKSIKTNNFSGGMSDVSSKSGIEHSARLIQGLDIFEDPNYAVSSEAPTKANPEAYPPSSGLIIILSVAVVQVIKGLEDGFTIEEKYNTPEGVNPNNLPLYLVI